MTEKMRSRAWYAGKRPAEPDFLRQLETSESDVHVLYTLEDGRHYGDYSEVMETFHAKVEILQEDWARSLAWSSEESMRTLLEAIVDFAASPEERINVLRQVGGFRFEQGMSAEEMQGQLAEVFDKLPGDGEPAEFDAAAASLDAVWSPQQGSLLEFIIGKPSEVAKLLTERLSPSTARYLGIIGHTFHRVRRTDLEPLAASQTVAYVRGSEIHLIVGVREVLEDWDRQREREDEKTRFSLLETLLLHEVMEIILREKMPRIDPLSSHVIASTLERNLTAEDLPPAVEDFFDSWIPPTTNRERRSSVAAVERDKRRQDRRQAEAETSLTDREEADAEGMENVLIVDDSTTMRRTICEIVKELGYGTLEAVDGREGFEMARRRNPRLIILDFGLPDMDGVEMLKQVRGDSAVNGVPVIVLTAEANRDIIRAAQELGVKDFLVKPLVADEVKKRIQKYLDNSGNDIDGTD
jgi:two-component system chemotaxis response regulator CheY